MSRRTILYLAFAFIIVLAAFFVVVRLSSTPELDQVAIAITFNLERAVGVQIQQGVALALAQYDYRAGDTAIELLSFDIAADNERENHRRTAERISQNDDIFAVIGAPSTAYARDVIPIYNEADLAIISPSATWAGLTKPGYLPGEPGIYYPTGTHNFFRSIPADDVQALAAVRWLAGQELRRIYVLTIADNRYSEGIAGILAANAPDWDLQIVGAQSIDLDTPVETMTRVVTEIQQARADVIYYPVVYEDEVYDTVFTLREQLPDTPLLSSDGLSGGVVGNSTPLMDGVYATSLTPPPDHVDAAAFVSLYRETYNAIPSPYALTAYDATLAIVKAIEEANPLTRQSVIRTLHTMDGINGAMGTWRFDDNGDTSLSYVTVMQFRDGDWHTVDYVEVN